jgi:hypothetical protein
MTLTEEQLRTALAEEREYMEGLIVRSHDGRMGSMSELFRDLTRKIDVRMDKQDERIKFIENTMKPFAEGVIAGKISYWFVLKVVGLVSAIGGMILLIKQLFK